MNPLKILALSARVYAFFLCLYPAHFRQQYSQPMAQVFGDCCLAAQHRNGLAGLAGAWLNALVDFVISVFKEYLAETRLKRAAAMDGLSHMLTGRFEMGIWALDFDQEDKPGSWRDALLAALPFAFFLLAAFLPELLIAFGVKSPFLESYYAKGVGIVLGGLGIPVLLAAIYYARKAGYPRWFGTWVMFVLVPVIAGFTALGKAVGPDVQDIYDVFFAILPLAIAYLLYRAARKDLLSGLLACLPMLLVLWYLNMEFIQPTARIILEICMWLLAGVTAAVIIRIGRLRTGLWIWLGLNLVVGLAVSLSASLFHQPISELLPVVWSRVLRDFVFFFITVSTVLIGPQIAARLRRMALPFGKPGMRAYRLVLLGVLLLLTYLVAHFAANGIVGGIVKTIFYHHRLTLALFVGLGITSYLLGIAWLWLLAARQDNLPGWGQSILLLMVPLCLPLVTTQELSPLGSYGVGWIIDITLATAYVLHLGWLAAALWLLFGGKSRSQPEELSS